MLRREKTKIEDLPASNNGHTAEGPSQEDAKVVHHPLKERSSYKRQEFLGRLYVVEGCDGSGKSTQIYLLKKWLESKGYNVLFTEWNSSELVKQATSKAKKKNALTPTTFSLIHATDFADRFERYILPPLKAGYIVMADRYKYTAFARDAARGCGKEWLRNLYSFAVNPNIAFYFQAPLQVTLNRILSGRPQLKYHEAGMDLNLSGDIQESFKQFQGLIKEEYDAMVEEEGLTLINATKDIDETQKIVRQIVEKDLENYNYIMEFGR